MTIDVAGNIKLNADGGQIAFEDGSTEIGVFENSSSNFSIEAKVQDKDILFKGNDGGSGITALTLDMSDAGTASFNHDVRVGDNSFFICGAGDDLAISSDGTDGKITTTTDLILDIDGGEIHLKDGGADHSVIQLDSAGTVIDTLVSDKDFFVNGNDGGTSITALRIDMSDAGAATFNNNVTAFSDERLKDNIETLEDGLAKVEQLRGVTYTRDNREQIGVIAQEVEKILPEIVLTADDEMGTKSVDYSRITAVLIEAVKDLSARVKELENK